MLLKLLYDFAISEKLLEDAAFIKKPVRWVIQLDAIGQLIGEGPIETHGNDEKKALELFIPKTTRATGGGQVADFLVDDIGALFNLNTNPQTDLNQRAANNLHGKHQDYWRQISEAWIATDHYGLSALMAFHDQLQGAVPPFLKLDSEGTPKWVIRKATGETVKLGSDLLTFAVDGHILINDEDAIKPYWRGVHAAEMETSEKEAQRGICLITGQVGVPIARTHTPMVTGLPKPARGTGAGLVGFDKNAFCSYGLKKSFNAPVSIDASIAYLAAIQHLSKQEDHWLAIGPAWLCFWTLGAKAASGFFANLLKRPDSKTVREFMVSPWKGFEQPPNQLGRFIAVTLSAAGPRIIVKDWLQISIGDAEKNLKKWFQDLDVAPYGSRDDIQDERSPLSIDQLASTTIQRKSDGKFDRDKLSPDLTSALYRAAIKKESPPLTLLKPLLDRFKSNIAKNGLSALRDQGRFALLKLTVNRQLRSEGKSEMQSHVFETNDPAYNCGRLLAIFDSLQHSAHGESFKGSTIAERYFGSASTAPNTAFSLLWKLHQHHLKKLRQQREKGQRAAAKIKGSITEIASLFSPEFPGGSPQFPRYFTLVEQGRFALGFYQQMAARKAAIDEHKRKKDAGELKPEDEELELSEREQ
ncbi:type I-C CRISPR-associated protein Cas8c/Csd1 [Candidatus Methylospira mobilis]|uniref:Type I-C CRISPR-associated protein Cas8c/Csd1 n=1 Tax=Candidatus Methylospira mobilis TaxID=1808979 RepID=A0A5Q0BIW2_9GAMM|nr:type I-C CRISPR-associated protein Cas8c/Csd1 [Candidatus Methylospira mobilis]QFY42141.1 type I-C CRISPR-associated protein Cas8c/Csd1 [Candidatus Methylospira mobilis]